MYTLLGCIKHKCRDSYVLNIPTVHAFGLVLLTHTLLAQTHTHDVSAPCIYSICFQTRFMNLYMYIKNIVDLTSIAIKASSNALLFFFLKPVLIIVYTL